MTFEPRSEDDIYDSIRTRLENSIDKLTNFVTGSFNDAFLQAYSEQVREAELKALAAELAGYVEYAGKDLTERDLDKLGVSGVNPDDINEYMLDEHLDNLAANLGVVRDPGVLATGRVRFEVSDSDVEIQDGFQIGTQPDSRGQFQQYHVDISGDGTLEFDDDETISPDNGAEEVEVDIVAAEPGQEYNVGPGSITYIPNPQPGIQAVTNDEPTEGGVDQQTNQSLRDDIANVLFKASGGGTASGIIGYIEREAETDVRSVGIDEHVDEQPPFVDVVVDGGETEEVEKLIAESKPVGVRHNLVRPNVIGTGILSHTVGTDVSSSDVRDAIIFHFDQLDSGDSFYNTQLLRDILDADSQIDSVPVLNTYINSIDRERILYDDTISVYPLEYGPIGSVFDEEHFAGPEITEFETMYRDFDETTVGVHIIEDDARRDLESTDYDVIADDGENYKIVLASGVEPDAGTVVTITYEHASGEFTEVVDVDGNPFVEGTDYDVIDSKGDGLLDAIEWTGTGDTPTDGEPFEMVYQPKRSFNGDLLIGARQKFDADTNEIHTENYTG